ncbi:MAG: non-hydrolyzing UDP-N-acetylglucosamine 2-epimerase [Bacillota bacterium]
MKFVTILGARPQFIKAAVVSQALQSTGYIKEIILHTGQHYDKNMSDIFFDEMEIPRPDIKLSIGSGNHGAQTGRMLEAIEKELLKEKPDGVIVYGDTNSTLAGALAACKLLIPCIHIEAGLRSFNRTMPEEINRILTDHLSELLFAPTKTAVENLSKEGINESKVFLVGDVMYDSTLYFSVRAEERSTILKELNIENKPYILTTIHRAENTDNKENLADVFKGLAVIAQYYPIIMPIHPRTQHALKVNGLWEMANESIKLIEPLGYLDIMMLEKNAILILTDSGGVQKEAFFHRIPCFTLRKETEWVELVDNGWNYLIPPKDLTNSIDKIIGSIKQKNSLAVDNYLYGGGTAAKRIAQIIVDVFRK